MEAAGDAAYGVVAACGLGSVLRSCPRPVALEIVLYRRQARVQLNWWLGCGDHLLALSRYVL